MDDLVELVKRLMKRIESLEKRVGLLGDEIRLLHASNLIGVRIDFGTKTVHVNQTCGTSIGFLFRSYSNGWWNALPEGWCGIYVDAKCKVSRFNTGPQLAALLGKAITEAGQLIPDGDVAWR